MWLKRFNLPLRLKRWNSTFLKISGMLSKYIEMLFGAFLCSVLFPKFLDWRSTFLVEWRNDLMSSLITWMHFSQSSLLITALASWYISRMDWRHIKSLHFLFRFFMYFAWSSKLQDFAFVIKVTSSFLYTKDADLRVYFWRRSLRTSFGISQQKFVVTDS